MSAASLDALLTRYAALDALIERAVVALRSSRCPCCMPLARPEALRLAAGVAGQTATLDRQLDALGLAGEVP